MGGHQVAWTYRIEAKETGSGKVWRTIKVVRWSREANGVATTFRFGEDRTLFYRVRPGNPRGRAEYSAFNNGQPITPGPRPG